MLILDKKPKKTDLLNQLAGVAARWRDIGEGLGVNDGDIESLQQSNQRDVNKLSSVLQKWMDTLCSDVSWRKILEVLDSPLVQKKNVADDIRKFLRRDDIFDKYAEQ